MEALALWLHDPLPPMQWPFDPRIATAGSILKFCRTTPYASRAGSPEERDRLARELAQYYLLTWKFWKLSQDRQRELYRAHNIWYQRMRRRKAAAVRVKRPPVYKPRVLAVDESILPPRGSPLRKVMYQKQYLKARQWMRNAVRKPGSRGPRKIVLPPDSALFTGGLKENLKGAI